MTSAAPSSPGLEDLMLMSRGITIIPRSRSTSRASSRHTQRRNNLECDSDHVKQVLHRLHHYHLYLKLEKCEFHQSATQFLGYVISPEGIQMDCAKVEAIKCWPQPSTVKDLQCFLGFANFYHRFISGYSDLLSPPSYVRNPRISAGHQAQSKPSGSCPFSAFSGTSHLSFRGPTFHVSLLKPFIDSVLPPPTEPEGPPPPEIDTDDTIYQVREVVNSRRRHGRLQYLVDWEGYGPEERSWVDQNDILDPLLLVEFHQRHPGRPAPGGRGRPHRRSRASGDAHGEGGTVTDALTTATQPRPQSPEF